MENLLCNWQQRELLVMRQIFIRYEATFRSINLKIAALQAENSTLQAANSQQQTINDQLQTTVITGLARLSAIESTGSAVPDCSLAFAAQAKQLEERINHVVASLGDISTFVGTSTVSNQLQTLTDRVQQRTVAVVKEWKMPNFKIEKFDDYHKTNPLQWWMAFNVEADVHHVPPERRLGALYLQLIGGAQAFMTHMAVTLECTIATLHTKITWEEFEKKWKTRLMVNNDKRHALKKIFRILASKHHRNVPPPSTDNVVAVVDLRSYLAKIDHEHTTQCRSLDEHLEDLRTVLERLSIAKYKVNCDKFCHRNKGRHQLPYGELEPLPIPREPDLSIAMDVTDPFPRDRLGHDGILTVVDRLSKYARFLPCKYYATAPELARLLHTGWFCSHGAPEDIVSDRDTRFMSAFWMTLMVESGTSMKPSSARHPQTDGQTERAHQTAQMMLRTLIPPDQKDKVDRLPDIEFAYNTSVHPAIGVPPFELDHGGRKGCIFAYILLPRAADIDAACSLAYARKYRELLAKARANMQKAQVRTQQQANRRRIPCPIRAGDLVWVTSEEFTLEQHVSCKLLPKWFGPWKVTSAAGDDPAGPSFIIEIPPHLMVHPVFHASKMAVYTPAS
ncbi:hypothetical protein CBR_g23121 [Chara braunii]|uniref:Integrase catalytic domain-containing protein n=1 Tax=Chara braunii TaxID=69332 RepID=A0A388L3N9_CHABU|nr:hypothetical protein CBR_g23121 [Chara braunii]|eukprot:GBG76907.1 hypothetical protein CBR_g23121 [Chara braunii]